MDKGINALTHLIKISKILNPIPYQRSWVIFNLRGERQSEHQAPGELPILQMDFIGPDDYHIIFKSDDKDMKIHSHINGKSLQELAFHE